MRLFIFCRFDLMRLDPHLCFLSRCGPLGTNEDELKKTLDNDENSKLDYDEDR